MANEKEDIKASKFIYRDKFSRNGWLNLMNERLKLAKDLLKDDGIIFVSIDDAEQAYLKVLMDEIFGEENFVANLVWMKKTGPSGNTSSQYLIDTITEYILCYAKDKTKKVFNYLKHWQWFIYKIRFYFKRWIFWAKGLLSAGRSSPRLKCFKFSVSWKSWLWN
nr:site-specific DNA-methyltransferase [Mesomycoplasma hyopneumoniae]